MAKLIPPGPSQGSQHTTPGRDTSSTGSLGFLFYLQDVCSSKLTRTDQRSLWPHPLGAAAQPETQNAQTERLLLFFSCLRLILPQGCSGPSRWHRWNSSGSGGGASSGNPKSSPAISLLSPKGSTAVPRGNSKWLTVSEIAPFPVWYRHCWSKLMDAEQEVLCKEF